jgi:hypothetical protein
MKKIREQDGGGDVAPSGDASGASYASLVNTPGMGDVRMPTANQPGSGDIWPNLMDFMTWKSKRKKNRARKRKKRS